MIIGAMPAFNEEKILAKAVMGTRKCVERVLVVDDGSSDATGETAEAVGTLVARHQENQISGGALRMILSETARKLHADQVAIIDSDDQHIPVDTLGLRAERQRGNDVVIVSRFVDGSNCEYLLSHMVSMKVLDPAIATAETSPAITYSQSGFRTYGRKAIDVIRIGDERMGASSGIPVPISGHCLKVTEVPIRVCYGIKKEPRHGFCLPWYPGAYEHRQVRQPLPAPCVLWDTGPDLHSIRHRRGVSNLLRVLPHRPVPLRHLHQRFLCTRYRVSARRGEDGPVLTCADHSAGMGRRRACTSHSPVGTPIRQNLGEHGTSHQSERFSTVAIVPGVQCESKKHLGWFLW